MAITHPTLPTGPLPHPAMDYAGLRTEGIALLGQLAGEQWTDYNTHDPGITILEQLCYAITDLAHRCNYPMADLLAAAPDTGLPGPTAILTGDPVTPDDLRRLALDVAQTEQAWVGAPPKRAIDFYYHEGSGQLRLRPDPSEPSALPVELRGLLAVAVQGDDAFAGNAALDRLALRLHAARALGSDFEIGWLGNLPVELTATIEVASTDDPTALLADIVEHVQDCLAPPARFVTLAEATPPGHEPRLDLLFEGPLLVRGIAQSLPQGPEAVYASDLIHAITDVAAVRAVRAITPPVVKIAKGQVARLAKTSSLTLLRAGLPLRASLDAAFALVEQRRRARRLRPMDLAALQPPPGRERALARYRSIQRQMPAVYGVGPLGVAGSAPTQRHAQVRQLQAYLLIFDQLLANQFAQLAHVHELLSPNPGGTRSVFTQEVDDPPLPLAELLIADSQPANAAAPAAELDRRKRLLAHLLARFAEQIGDHAQVQAADARALVAARQDFLAQMARLSGARGSGFSLYADAESALPERLRAIDTAGAAPAAGAGAGSALAERLRLKLCLPDIPLHIVEHVLLRPLPEDKGQLDDDGGASVPLLDGVGEADPWSLRLSVVLRKPMLGVEGRDAAWFDSAARYINQTLLAEIPAHLATQVHWFDDVGDFSWAAFDAAWAAFRGRLAEYRWPAAGADLALAALRLRDARDRVIELLGIGRTAPLRDLPWAQQLIVPAGTPTEVLLGYSQLGVNYALYDTAGVAVLRRAKPVVLPGTGATLALPTPPITVDVTYRVLATKTAPAGLAPRSAWLRGAVRIEEGVDPTLTAVMAGLDPLDATHGKPNKADEARIADHGVDVVVTVQASQEGVNYRLVDAADTKKVLSAEVTGTSGDIALLLPQVTEDIDLRIYAWRMVGAPGQQQLRAALLNTVLPLRVRASRAVAAVLALPIVAHGGSAGLELKGTQASATYRPWRRPLRDSDYWFAWDVRNGLVETVDVAGDTRPVSVRRPPHLQPWQQPSGFVPAADAEAGSGAALPIDIGTFDHDGLLLVQAEKQHRTLPEGQAGSGLITSAVQLDQALVQLVRPDTAPRLRLRTEVDGSGSTGLWSVSGGEPGVAYELRVDAAAIGLAAYMHQRDDRDAGFNQGLEQLRVEIDFSLARDDAAPSDRARIAPPLPLVEARAVPLGSEVTVLAWRAMSGVTARLQRSAMLDAMPSIAAVAPRVRAGQPASIVVSGSVAGEFYSLEQEGAIVAGPVEGDGSDITLDSGPITGRTEILVLAENRDGKRLALARGLRLKIDVS